MRPLALAAILVLVTIAGYRAKPAVAVTYPAGWNLVAGPGGSQLRGALGNLYTLQPGDVDYETQASTAPLVSCRGYWAYFPTGGSIIFGPGSAMCSSALIPGAWAMLGGPSAVGYATIADADTVLTYTPGGDYQQADTVLVGQGAWVQAQGVVTLTAVNATPPSAAMAVPPTPPPAAAAPTAPPALAPVAAPLSAVPTEADVQALVASIPMPAGIQPRTVLAIVHPGGIIPIYASAFLDLSPSVRWILLPDATKFTYLRAVLQALHTRYPVATPIYFSMFNDIETNAYPAWIDPTDIEVCPASVRYVWCATYVENKVRYINGLYQTERFYDSPWLPLP